MRKKVNVPSKSAIEPITHIDWEPQAAQSDLMDKINELVEAVNLINTPLKTDHLGKYVVFFPGAGTNIQHYFDTYEASEKYAEQIKSGPVTIAYVLYESDVIKQAQRMHDIASRLKMISPTTTK